jgi:hypothetical protein
MNHTLKHTEQLYTVASASRINLVGYWFGNTPEQDPIRVASYKESGE